ncbi:MAG TPA: FAD-dependent oxidoreductase [Acidobacteriota bacterium]|nr:FAD-dependent oxidoreductase [Acidobacteriota bacterium]
MAQKCEYLIIGAGLAGHHAAAEIRARDEDATLVIIGAEPHRPYNRPPLSKAVLTGQAAADSVFIEKKDFYADKGIELICGAAASALDADKKKVILADGREMGYGKLLIATGGNARRLNIPGWELPGVFTLRSLDDSLAIKEAAAEAGRVAVIGGGFVGAEAASSLAESGKKVAAIFPQETYLGRILPYDFGQFLNRVYRERGVEILPGDSVVAFEGNGRLKRLQTTKGKAIECDLAVVGAGIELQTAFAREALELDRSGAIVTDGQLRSSAEDIWAAGDIASYYDGLYRRQMRFEHWSTAMNQGKIAGAAMAGDPQPFASPAYFFSVLFGMFIQIGGNFEPGDTVRRGDPNEKAVGYYSFHEGVIEGYTVLGRPQEEEKFVQKLILDRRRKEDLAKLLADEAGDLSSLV